MVDQIGQIPLITVAVSAIVSVVTAIITAFATSKLAHKREHESDWRKLKLSQYQEFVLALSGIVEGRETLAAHYRFADAQNAMSLIASMSVLTALREFLDETSSDNSTRTQEKHNLLLNKLLQEMRRDSQPRGSKDDPSYKFILYTVAPKWRLPIGS